MFFVFHFLVFAYFTRSEINCFTQGTIRAKNYVREHEEISNLRGAAEIEGVIYSTNKPNLDLKSNVFDKILSDEMLSEDDGRILKDSSNIPLLSTKHHLVTPTLEIKQKWPMFKYVNSVNEVARKDQEKNFGSQKTPLQKIIKNDDEYLNPVPTPEIILGLRLDAKKPFEVLHNTPKTIKVSGLKSEILKPSEVIPINNKVVGMRSLPDKERRQNKNPSASCNSCKNSGYNKKRCTHFTPGLKTHECSRYGVASYVTNHSCSPGQKAQDLLFQNQEFQTQPAIPYSFYPVYLPYSYFATEPPDTPYKLSYLPPNLTNGPGKHKCKNHKATGRPDDDLYYEDNDSRERRPFDDSEYYSENTKQKGILFDVNQDALIKEIVKDLKIQNNNELGKECYCNSSLRTCKRNLIVLIITLFCFAL